ncbi:bacteriocin immunity protein [Lactococcus sp.]|uniref:bacteriocin immunity protein n=1 Tax=Lactococcus sp. TaxID=44273 RepID=UPI0035AFEF15
MVTKIHFGNKEEMLNKLYNLILNEKTTPEERMILRQAKENLELGQDLQRVVLEMKKRLSPIMAQQKFSEEVLVFFKELSSQYLGLGERGAVFIL